MLSKLKKILVLNRNGADEFDDPVKNLINWTGRFTERTARFDYIDQPTRVWLQSTCHPLAASRRLRYIGGRRLRGSSETYSHLQNHRRFGSAISRVVRHHRWHMRASARIGDRRPRLEWDLGANGARVDCPTHGPSAAPKHEIASMSPPASVSSQKNHFLRYKKCDRQ